MRKLIFYIIVFISFISFGQNHPAKLATETMKKYCYELTSFSYPTIREEGLRIDSVICDKGAISYEMNLYQYESSVDQNSIIKTAIHKAYSNSINTSSLLTDFKKQKWQISYIFYDKNKKFLFSLVYDTNENNQYVRNLNAENIIKKFEEKLSDINNG